jgi:hypothetical protein
VQTAGLVAGVVAAATGVGAVVEGVTAAGFGLGVTAAISGTVASSIDGVYCHDGSKLSCVGLAFGATGAVTGGLATGGALFATEGSVADSVFQGLGAFSSVVGVGGILSDTLFTLETSNTKASTKSVVNRKKK